MTQDITIHSNPPAVEISVARVYTVTIENRSQTVVVEGNRPAVSVAGVGTPYAVPGPRGFGGSSAYEVAVSEGFTGDEQEWLASLVGPPGATNHDLLENVGTNSHAQIDTALTQLVPKSTTINSKSLSGPIELTPADIGADPAGAAAAISKTSLGLGNIDNTSDADKPVSAAQQTALDGKEPANANIQTHIAVVAGNPHGVSAAMIGLGNATNTSDADKPVSTAQQTALNAKQDVLVSGVNLKTVGGVSLLGIGDLAAGGMANPMTTAGDIIIGGTAGAATRLAKGDDGDVLTLASGTPGWSPPAASGADSSGWTAVPETATYSSAGAPIYSMSFASDVSGNYSPGMRMKLSQATGGVKYFIIVKVVFSSPNTIVSLYGGTDYALTNETISNLYSSTHKAPVGFPLERTKWITTLISDATMLTQATVSDGVWYNVGSLSCAIPVGAWIVKYAVVASATRTRATTGAVASNPDIFVTLSTANNTASNSAATDYAGGSSIGVLSPAALYSDTVYSQRTKDLDLVLAAATTYYLNAKASSTEISNLRFRGDLLPTGLTILCAYL